MKDWKKVHGSQAEQPPEFDTTSSPTTVYQRRNVKRVIIENGDGTKSELWEYEERKMTREEYSEFERVKMQSNIAYLSMMTGINLD